MKLPQLDNIARLSELNIERFGEYESLVVGEERWTNGSLHLASRRLAAALSSLGLQPGDRIATLAPNSAELLIAYQATFCLGATLVPLLADLTADEVCQRLRDCEACAIIGAATLLREIARELDDLEHLTVVVTFERSDDGPAASTFPPVGRARVASMAHLIAGATQPMEPAPRESDDVACIVYTGATTSAAKGVMQTHGNIFANVRNNTPYNKPLTDLIALPMAHSFGMGVWLSTFVMGAKLVLLDRFDVARACELIERHRVARMVAVPTMMLTMLDHPAAEQHDLSSVEAWGMGGAPISEAQVERFVARFGGRIEKGYGLTEACPTIARVWPDLPDRRGSCGKPLPGVEVRIVSPESGEPLAVGKVGEICARGDNISPGYYRLPEESARVFRDGWLHTGDLGRFDDDGYLYIVGRAKDVIVQAGFNVYPAEVEGVLARHPAVAEAAVIGVEDALVGEAVVAFVTRSASAGQPLHEPTLLEFCRVQLAAYKLPVRALIVDALPRTTIGKVDKKSLHESAASELNAAAVRMCDEPFRFAGLDEAQLEALVARFGGRQALRDVYSLTAAQRDALPALLDDTGSVTDLALHARALRLELDFELSADVSRTLDQQALQRAFGASIVRHPALRATLALAATDRPVLLEWPQAEPLGELRDLRQLAAADQLAQLAQLAASYRGDRPPWIDLSLARLDDTHYRLVVFYERAVFDAHSVLALADELVAELARVENAAVKRRAPRAYIAWLERRDLAADTELWRALRPQALAFSGGWSSAGRADAHRRVCIDIGASGHAGLLEMTAELGVPIETVLVGGWALAFGVVTERRRMLAAVLDWGRNAPLAGAASMVGAFSHRLPLLVQLADESDLATWLQGLREQLIEQRACEHALTEAALRELWGGPPAQRPFDMGVAVHLVQSEPAAGVSARVLPQGTPTARDAAARCDLPIELSIALHSRADGAAGEIGGCFDYDCARYRDEQVHALGARFIAALEALMWCATVGEAIDEIKAS